MSPPHPWCPHPWCPPLGIPILCTMAKGTVLALHGQRWVGSTRRVRGACGGGVHPPCDTPKRHQGPRDPLDLSHPGRGAAAWWLCHGGDTRGPVPKAGTARGAAW